MGSILAVCRTCCKKHLTGLMGCCKVSLPLPDRGGLVVKSPLALALSPLMGNRGRAGESGPKGFFLGECFVVVPPWVAHGVRASVNVRPRAEKSAASRARIAREILAAELSWASDPATTTKHSMTPASGRADGDELMPMHRGTGSQTALRSSPASKHQGAAGGPDGEPSQANRQTTHQRLMRVVGTYQRS